MEDDPRRFYPLVVKTYKLDRLFLIPSTRYILLTEVKFPF